METKSAKRVSASIWIMAAIVVGLLGTGAFYLSRPTAAPADEGSASADAKAYLPNLELSDVSMQASENFMKQQVVEVQGKIANHGPRKLAAVEVYCLFYGVDRKEIYRERLPVVRNLSPQESKGFRLPFDNLPDGWNQAMPRLVIARISFSS